MTQPTREEALSMAREAGMEVQVTALIVPFIEALVSAAYQRGVEDAHKQRGTMLFNPYMGNPRNPFDIQSDPHGILMVDPDQPLHAARSKT